MGFEFKKATKSQSKARIALNGPAGSGKTYSALAIAKNLGGKVAVIDTERGSASKYASDFEFDTLDLSDHDPRNYVEAVKMAAKSGYNVCIIDSLSHAWMGTGGALEMADNASKRGGNTFTAWRDVTPMHNKLVDTILSAPMHIIVTMRTHTEYVMEKDERGKTVPKKIGLAPVQRKGVEFEFDIIGDMDLDNNLIVSKTRCSALNRKTFFQPGKDFADIVKSWLSDGSPSEEKVVGKLVLGPPLEPKFNMVMETELGDKELDEVSLWQSRIKTTPNIQKLEALKSEIKALPGDLPSKLYESYKQRKQELTSS